VTQERANPFAADLTSAILAPMGSKSVVITLNPQQARELYDYLEDDDSPPYWECALAPVHAALRETLGEW
jgi:hypothetical protein